MTALFACADVCLHVVQSNAWVHVFAHFDCNAELAATASVTQIVVCSSEPCATIPNDLSVSDVVRAELK